MSKTASKAKKVAGQDARRSEPEKKTRASTRRIVMNHFPHSRPGRPRIVEDLVGGPY